MILNLSRAAHELWRNVDAVDNVAAKRRVDQARRHLGTRSKDAIHRHLVQQKCLRAAAAGAVGNAIGAVPLIGPVLSPVVGTLADATLVTKLQAELVVETFYCYDIRLPEKSERLAVATIAATNVGAHQIGRGVAKFLVRESGSLIGRRAAKTVSPFAAVAAGTATDIAMTYAIGMRARGIAKMRDAPFEEWPELLRQVTSIDERKLARWALESGREAFEVGSRAAKALVARLAGVIPDAAVRVRSRRVEPRPAARRAGGAKRGASKRAPATRTEGAAKRSATAGKPRRTRKRSTGAEPST